MQWGDTRLARWLGSRPGWWSVEPVASLWPGRVAGATRWKSGWGAWRVHAHMSQPPLLPPVHPHRRALQAEIEDCDRHGGGNADLPFDEQTSDWSALVAAAGESGGSKEDVDALVLPLL